MPKGLLLCVGCVALMLAACGVDERVRITVVPSTSLKEAEVSAIVSLEIRVSGADTAQQVFNSAGPASSALFADGSARVFFLPNAEAQGNLIIDVRARDENQRPMAVGQSQVPLLRGQGARADVLLVRPSSCENGIRDQEEGDVDCGGPHCQTRCPYRSGCNNASDCTEGSSCLNGECAPASCSNAIKDGDEADSDCGGSCPGCTDGGACTKGTDCRSGFCATTGRCAPCGAPADCASGSECVDGTCKAPSANTRPCVVLHGTGTQAFSGNSWGECTATACDADYHLNGPTCEGNTRTCVTGGGSGTQTWNGSSYGMCVATGCPAGQHLEGGNCTPDTKPCVVANGAGIQLWNGATYASCQPTQCNAGYHLELQTCANNTRECIVGPGRGTQSWTGAGYGVCLLAQCVTGFHLESNACLGDTQGCSLTGGNGTRTWSNGSWGACMATSCFGAYHLEASTCASNTRSCFADANGLGSQTWNGASYGPCALTNCYSGFALQGGFCAPVVGDCGDPDWKALGTFTCDAAGVQHQLVCGCHPPGYSNPDYWIDAGNQCYAHSTGQSCAVGTPPMAGGCGPGWMTIGTFTCDPTHLRRQTVCGCLPPGYTDPMLWNNLGGNCYSHLTGEAC